jgi:hypothetical protein
MPSTDNVRPSPRNTATHNVRSRTSSSANAARILLKDSSSIDSWSVAKRSAYSIASRCRCEHPGYVAKSATWWYNPGAIAAPCRLTVRSAPRLHPPVSRVDCCGPPPGRPCTEQSRSSRHRQGDRTAAGVDAVENR